MQAPVLASWNIDPGKWPRLLVTGEPVTETQANDILIRTANLYYLECNDLEWNRTVARIVLDDKHAAERGRFRLSPFEQVRSRAETLGNLRLEYLHNDRISSSWIGGSRGWCDWDGQIGSVNYNIGKWPSLEEVGNEWAEIAKAFPYLDLTVQLVVNRGYVSKWEGQVCAQWRLSHGRAVPEPTSQLLVSDEQQAKENETTMVKFLDQPFSLRTERGVSAERLQEAVDQVLNSRT